MTVIRLDPDGLGRVADALRAGDPVILPPPSPITYGIAGTDPFSVNRVKGRPEFQPVAIGLTSLQPLTAWLDVPETLYRLVEWLIFSEMLTVLVPVRPGAPAWLAPAVNADHVLAAGAWLPETLPVLHNLDVVYLSSGDPTGRLPATTAAEADQLFEGQMLVLDADHLRDPSRQHGATTMVKVDRSGTLTLARQGIQDAGCTGGGQPYLDGLSLRFIRTQ